MSLPSLPQEPHGTWLSYRHGTLFVVTISRALLGFADLSRFGNRLGILWNIPLVGVVQCVRHSQAGRRPPR